MRRKLILWKQKDFDDLCLLAAALHPWCFSWPFSWSSWFLAQQALIYEWLGISHWRFPQEEVHIISVYLGFFDHVFVVSVVPLFGGVVSIPGVIAAATLIVFWWNVAVQWKRLCRWCGDVQYRCIVTSKRKVARLNSNQCCLGRVGNPLWTLVVVVFNKSRLFAFITMK